MHCNNFEQHEPHIWTPTNVYGVWDCPGVTEAQVLKLQWVEKALSPGEELADWQKVLVINHPIQGES